MEDEPKQKLSIPSENEQQLETAPYKDASQQSKTSQISLENAQAVVDQRPPIKLVSAAPSR